MTRVALIVLIQCKVTIFDKESSQKFTEMIFCNQFYLFHVAEFIAIIKKCNCFLIFFQFQLEFFKGFLLFLQHNLKNDLAKKTQTLKFL